MPALSASIFSDGFESGDLSQWSGTSGTISVVSAQAHHGTRSVTYSTSPSGFCFKDFSLVDETYARCYVRFSSLPSSGFSSEFFSLYTSGWSWRAGVAVGYHGGTPRFDLVDWNYNFLDSGSPNLVVGKWYCIEVSFKRGAAGWAKLWVDDVLKVNVPGDTSALSQSNRLVIGTFTWFGASYTAFSDCVVVADAPIGMEAVAPTFSNIAASTTRAGSLCEFQAKWTAHAATLDKCTFSTNNTGSWLNYTNPPTVSGTESWANITLTLNSTVGVPVGFRWRCNDTEGNWGDTGIQTLVTSGDWQYAKKIQFNNAAVSENLANFPALINLTRAGSDFWSHVNSSSNDLRFMDRDCVTELYCEVEYWDYVGNEGLVWVKVPQIDASSASDFIYLEYGNPSPPVSPFHDSTKVWGDYRLVQHLRETSGTHQDSTSNNNDGSPVNGVLQGVAGRIDGADDFDGTNDYVSLGNSSSLTLTQYTIEAWIRRDGDGVATATSGGTGGFTGEPVIAKGTSYNDNSGMNINYFLGINQTGRVVGFDFEDIENSGLNHAVLGSTPLADGQWYCVVATYDGTTKIFLNGNLDASTYLGVTPDSCQWDAAIGTAVSGAGAGTPHGAFNGIVDEVRIASGARSAQWIKAQYLSMIDQYIMFGIEQAPHEPPNKPVNPVPFDGAADVATSTRLSVDVTHPDGDSMDVAFYQAGTEAPETFTLIALPDTQFYSQDYPAIYDTQTQWVVNNAEDMNIVFVTHEGDIVNTDSSATQWQNADHSMSILDNGNFGWGMAPGNHDLNGGPGTNFNYYFPFSRFSGETWYGGAFNDFSTNNYELFKGGDDDYLILHLQYDANDTILSWANTVIAAHPEARVIVTTHRFLLADGTRDTATSVQHLWDNVITPHADQVFLVLCGHYVTSGVGEANRTDIVNGHPVHQLLADYQTRTSGGTGWLRILEFRPAEDKIYVKTYSPYLSQYETDANSQFTLNYDMTGEAEIPTTLIGTAFDVPSGTTATVPWYGLSSLTTYNWYAVAIDSDGASCQSNTWSFTTRVSSDPTFSNISHNTTLAGATCKFAAKWTDPDGLDKCIFSTNNTGTWQNSTLPVSGTESWANTTLTLPGTPGTVVGYRWYCNDTLGNTGDTGIGTLTTSGDWLYAMKITFSNTGIGENLMNVPILVNLTRAGAAFWSHVSSNVNDLRFMDSNFATELYYEVEYWSYAGNQGLVWVKVPQIDAGSASDFIWLYYGNLNPPANPYNVPANVWDSNYVLVLHLSEASGTRYDSTGNNNDGSPSGTPTVATGKVDGACDLDNAADYLQVSDSASLDYGDSLTLEMWLNPHDVSTNFGGIDKGTGTIYLLGNNTAGHYGKLRLGLSGTNTIVASNTALSAGSWTYAVGTKNGAEAKIYLNGLLDAQTSTSMTGTNNALNLRIGQRPGYASEYLNSIADEIRISNIARSAGWIKSQYLSMTDQYVIFGSEQEPPHPPDKPFNPDPADEATDVPTSTTLSVTVTDPDGDPMDVSFYQVTQQQQVASNFTIVVLPDTQRYSASYPAIYTNQTQWIVNNAGALNIVFVTHEGDIVDSLSSITQWDRANASMSLLDAANIPYGLAAGNHDIDYSGLTITNYNTYFPYSRYSAEAWYGGAYNTVNTNSYQLFTVGEDEYLIFHLQIGLNSTITDWANTVIANHPNSRIIIVTHRYMTTSLTLEAEGTLIWNNLIVPHSDQIFLILCGHHSREYMKTDVVNGHTVYQLLADYQTDSNGGNGWLRMLDFRPAEDKIYVKTFSPYLNQYETDSDSQFTLNYDMTGTAAIPPTLIGTDTDVPSGGTASVPWNGLDLATTYYWYAVADDGNGGTAQSDTWNCTTTATSTVEYELNLNAGWNMVSFPVMPEDTSFSSIFSGLPYYQVLTWSGTSYVTPTNVEAGRGYWVLVQSATTVEITGLPVESYALDLPAGWSMIGSVHGSTVDAGTVFPGYYQLLTWSGTSYVTVTTIEPGKGYWALVQTPTHIEVP